MINYVARRIMKGLVTLFITVTLTFLIVRLMPSDPVMLAVDSRISQGHIDRLIAQYGLDKPLWEQYFLYLGNLLRGNMGISFLQQRPVSVVLMERLPWTLLLMVTTQVLTMCIGIPLGIYSGYKRGRPLDQAVNAISIFGISIFVPWLAFNLMSTFSVRFRIFPIGGAYSPGITQGLNLAYIQNVIMHFTLPVITLMLIYLANYVLYTRVGIIDVMSEDYIRTARAKGMGENRVLWRHAAKNAMIPTVTSAGIMLGTMVGGAILTETVYAYPGVGRMIYQAVSQQDYPVLQGAFIMLATSVIVINIITDVFCAYLDPRIRLEKR